MTGKFMSPRDVHVARREHEIWNSMLKRGEIDPNQFVRTAYVVCGCGAEGCGFITRWMKTQPNVIDLEQQRELYQRWLEHHNNHN